MSQDSSAITSDPVLRHVLEANRKWSEGFDKPMKLGVNKKLVVLTCMDSRLIPENFLGLDIGDAEIIRNGGGRVTLDVLRSMVICQDLLKCERMLVIHHTDCGGQALYRKRDEVMQTLHLHMTTRASLPLKALWIAGWYASSLVPGFLRRAAFHAVTHDIPDLYESVVEDLKALRAAPNIKPDLRLYGLVYSTDTGKLTPLCADTGGGKLVLTDEYKKVRKLFHGSNPDVAMFRAAMPCHAVGSTSTRSCRSCGSCSRSNANAARARVRCKTRNGSIMQWACVMFDGLSSKQQPS